MPKEFLRFFGDHPVWAILIFVFMVLPMIGAVLHIVLKALGGRGIDYSPPSRIDFPPTREENELDNSEEK